MLKLLEKNHWISLGKEVKELKNIKDFLEINKKFTQEFSDSWWPGKIRIYKIKVRIATIECALELLKKNLKKISNKELKLKIELSKELLMWKRIRRNPWDLKKYAQEIENTIMKEIQILKSI